MIYCINTDICNVNELANINCQSTILIIATNSNHLSMYIILWEALYKFELSIIKRYSACCG